jgi:hypothetical protein
MSSRLRPLAALAVIALIGAGCSNAPAETDSGSGSGTATTRAKAVKFAQCMRDHGIQQFPDPDASGSLTIDGVANGSSVDPSSPAFDRALSACRDLQPAGFTGRKRSASQQQAALQFAQCVRDHGVKDFPDPVAGDPLVDTNRIPSANREGGMDILNAAMHTCGKVYAGRLGLKP